tara:strand:+ start:466 stop:606 length:141 start_codon:yes stop_codon:yes gene_type:complete
MKNKTGHISKQKAAANKKEKDRREIKELTKALVEFLKDLKNGRLEE